MGASDRELKLKRLTRLLFVAALVLFLTGYIYYEPFMIRHRKKLPISISFRLPNQIKRPFYPVWMQDLNHEEISAAYESLIRKELKINYPLFEVGDEIQIETTRGSAYAGIFQGLEDQNLLIKIKDKIKAVPLSALTIKSRLYCDEAGREVFADKVARKRAMAFLMAEDGEIHSEIFMPIRGNEELLGKRSRKNMDSLGRHD